jgi:sodium/bile acid cotransporter 7
MLGFLSKNWFPLGIVVAVTCGFVFPELGRSLNPQSVTTTAIVILVFLFSGFTLPSETILAGLANWRLHVFIQIFVFVVPPLLVLATSWMLRGLVPPGLLVGIVALACLPTTISSCVVFTQVSGGNVVATLFNASLNNAMGVFVSPLLLSWFLGQSGLGLPAGELGKVLSKLAVQMLVPLVIGQVLRQFAREFAKRHAKKFSSANNTMILLIVFFSVSRSAGHPAFSAGIASLTLPAIYLAIVHLALVTLAWQGGRFLRLEVPDRISVLYAAPQKTLAMGAPLLGIYFASKPELLGIAILPLLFYHPFQLIVAGVIRSSRLLPRTKA